MNERIVQMLTRLAIDNPGVQNRCKLSAGVVFRKNLIATGVNGYKTHPMMMPENGYREGQMYLHAEPDAIKNALRLVSQDQLARCDLYVIRVKRPYTASKTWIQGIAKPCVGCMKTIALYGIKNVYWTTDEDDTFETQEQGHRYIG
jgi:tRNA(Arg) A34 adenosine deaminase TadA|tara:strand:- start:53 stop:490 length:438 start_codon:yes stop_codon:yes gene_type:complete